MGKFQLDAMLDAGLDYISSNVVELYVCTTEPANYAGIAALALTGAAVPSFQANADGDVSGRKKAVDEEADISITGTGDAQHIVLASASVLIYITTCTLQGLTSGGTVTVPTWDIELEDVTP